MPAHPSDDRPPHSAAGDAAPTVAPSGSAIPDFHSDGPGDVIGPYTLVSPLGEGGFGTVWLAERRQPFVQQVALKIIKAGMDSKAVVARFEQERQALAVMNHPGIAKVLDGGLTPRGRPYFAMEYVKGDPITSFCDRYRLGTKDRLGLFLQVCEAVQHAHMKGIIHRDLKPSNVLVAPGPEDRPHAKVIDFGIAKAVSGRMTERTLFTETGQMMGTPEYMSPEQADPGGIDIDTRTDVYSLGVILYELLSGVLPFDPRDLRSKAYREIQRVICEEDPPKPSARLSTIATKDASLATAIGDRHRDSVKSLSAALRRELEWIPLKAMRKDRQERYVSPTELAQDVRNYLSGRPLAAGPESRWYRVRKHVRRNQRVYAVFGIVIPCLSLAAMDSLFGSDGERQSRKAEYERRNFVVARLIPEAVRAENWNLALHLMEALPDGFEFTMSRSPEVGHRLVRFGLADLPADSPARDLNRLRWLAERSAEDSRRRDAAVLETLARIEWELGDKPKAIGIQREAIAVHAAGMGESPSAEAEAIAAKLAATLDRYESRAAGMLDRRDDDLSFPQAPRPTERAEHERRYELVAGLIPEAVHAEDWNVALHLMEALPDGFRFATSWSPSVGNQLVRFGLTALPADSPARDLERLLWLAERAVDDSRRQDAAVLATLARVHWELGDRPKAIEIQREAIAVHAAGSGEPVTPEAKALAAGMAATLASYESLPAGAALPKEPEAPTSP